MTRDAHCMALQGAVFPFKLSALHLWTFPPNHHTLCLAYVWKQACVDTPNGSHWQAKRSISQKVIHKQFKLVCLLCLGSGSGFGRIEWANLLPPLLRFLWMKRELMFFYCLSHHRIRTRPSIKRAFDKAEGELGFVLPFSVTQCLRYATEY